MAGAAAGLGTPGRPVPSAVPSHGLRLPDSLPHPHVPAGTDMLPAVEHVVILMMENHSFDDHFGRLGRGDGLKVASDGTPLNYNPAPDGGYILSYPMPNTAVPEDSMIGQNWNTSHLCWDHGTNMGFARNCGPASMGHFTAAQLPFYYSLASQFPIGDRYFSLGHGADVPEPPLPYRRHGVGRHSDERHRHLVEGRAQRDDLRPSRHVQHQLEGLLPRRCRRARCSCPSSATTSTTASWRRSTTSSSDAAAGTTPPVLARRSRTPNYSEEDGDISIGEAYAARIIGAVLASPNWPKTVDVPRVRRARRLVRPRAAATDRASRTTSRPRSPSRPTSPALTTTPGSASPAS